MPFFPTPLRRSIVGAFALSCLLLAAPSTKADGLIIVHGLPGTPDHFAFTPLEVKYHKVSVHIERRGGVALAVTEVDQAFFNPSARQLEGTYLFPLPADASVERFSMDIDSKDTPAELLAADQARTIYEDIVRKYKDPALMEYAGRGAMKVRIFPIDAHGTKRVQLRYSQVLKADGGLFEYVYTLGTEKFSAKPLESIALKVDIAAPPEKGSLVEPVTPLKAIYSPSHDIDITRRADGGAVAGFEGKNLRPDKDFKLIFSADAKDVAISVLTHRVGNEGYFAVIASPGAPNGTQPAQPKDVCFVVDTSGSMAGEKLEQTRRALRYCISSLRPDDCFEIVRFSTAPEPLFGELRAVTAATDDPARKAALAFVDTLAAKGGTAINDALTAALTLKPKDAVRPFFVVFLTDGLPTIGQTNPDAIAASAKAGVGGTTRIFSFGIGNDVNTILLDRLAGDTRGSSQYVGPTEDIEVKVSSFFEKVQSPVLTGLKLAVRGGKGDGSGGDFRATDFQPSALPDLFQGETLLALGRFTGTGEADVTLEGQRGSGAVTFSSTVDFSKAGERNGFLPRLWATRRIGFLIDEIRLHGESAELKTEIIALARQHGIVSPYTAYLILEDDTARRVPEGRQVMRELRDDAAAAGRVRDQYRSADKASGALEASGGRAVQNAQVIESLKSSANTHAAEQALGMQRSAAAKVGSSPASGAAQGYRSTTNYAQQVRVAAGRAFYQNGTVWTDAALASAKADAETRQIETGSDAYFALTQKHTELTELFALGRELDIVVDGIIYNIR